MTNGKPEYNLIIYHLLFKSIRQNASYDKLYNKYLSGLLYLFFKSKTTVNRLKSIIFVTDNLLTFLIVINYETQELFIERDAGDAAGSSLCGVGPGCYILEFF